MIILGAAVFGLCGRAPLATAIDWDSCADELDRVRGTARDASDNAQEVHSKKEELENCLNYPRSYDYSHDRRESRAVIICLAIGEEVQELMGSRLGGMPPIKRILGS